MQEWPATASPHHCTVAVHLDPMVRLHLQHGDESEPSAKQPVRSLQPQAGVNVEYQSGSGNEPQKGLQPTTGVNDEHNGESTMLSVKFCKGSTLCKAWQLVKC